MAFQYQIQCRDGAADERHNVEDTTYEILQTYGTEEDRLFTELSDL